MRRSLSISVVIGLAIFGLSFGALAQEAESDSSDGSTVDGACESSTTYAPQPEVLGMKYRSAARITMQGGVAFHDTNRQADGSGSAKGGSGSVLVEIGRGILSFELGASYLESPSRENGALSRYAGVAMQLRFNYIEQPSAALSLKLGAMPARNTENGSDDVLIMGGLTGSAPITDVVSFVIDSTYFRGTRSIDTIGTLSEGMVAALGLRFAL